MRGHLVTNIPEYLANFGLKIDVVKNAENVPTSAKEIAETFKNVSSYSAKMIEEQWTDETLKQVQIAFGREESNAMIIMGLIKHIVHHRGQVTVLMRQAGIKPFGVYAITKRRLD